MSNDLHRPIKYRPEVDGLRAVAVLPVILFHAGFEYFSGGFVGVDVFFVISGYLITSIILSELAGGKFSILRFYDRRARRILPALGFVILAFLPLAWLWLPPNELRLFGQGLVAVVSFSSNIYFWLKTDYFAPAAEENALLHTWSLAVEEQYYLFFPLLLMALWRFGTRRLFITIAVLALASLLASEWAWRNVPAANFYLLPTRAWELLAGSLLAFWHHRSAPAALGAGRLAAALAAAGLAMIAYSVFAFTEKTPFPSLYALVPVGGSVLVIAFASGTNLAGRLLSSRLAVGIGLISYSAYLWHQPLFAFARIKSAGQLSVPLALALALLSLALAYLSWKFVEAPFRSKSAQGWPRLAVFGSAAGLLATLGAVGFTFHWQNGFTGRLDPTVVAQLKKYQNYKSTVIDMRVGKCFHGDAQEALPDLQFMPECFGHDAGAAKRVYLIGDSHAAALYPGLSSLHTGQFALAQFNLSGCLPLIDNAANAPPRCRKLNPERFRSVETGPGNYLVLAARWPKDIGEQAEGETALRLRNTLREVLKALPAQQVVLVGNVPEWGRPLPLLFVSKHMPLPPDRELRMENPDLSDLRARNIALRKIAGEFGVRFVDPLDLFCDESGCLAAVHSERQGYELSAWDYGHLSYSSSLLLARKVVKEFGT